MKTERTLSLGLTSCTALPLALLLVGLALHIEASTAFAQSARLELNQLDKLAAKASDVTDVNLEGPMLRFAAEQMSAKGKKPDASRKGGVPEMLQRLQGIYVKAFEFSQPGQYTRTDLDSVLKQLETGGWKSMVHVEERKSGETTGIYLMEQGGQTVGMAIVNAEPKELTVVNLVGPINFSELGGLGALGALGQLGKPPGGVGDGEPQLQQRSQTRTEGENK